MSSFLPSTPALLTHCRDVLDAAPDAMVLVAEDGQIAVANGEAERLFGYESETLAGQSIEVLVPPRFRAKHPFHRAGFVAHPSTRPMGSGLELSGLRRDGTEFPVEISLRPIPIDDRQFVIAAIRDVSARARSTARFRDLLEAAPDAMVIVNPDGTIALVNSQAEHLFGYSREELLGKPIDVLVPDRVRGAHIRHRAGYFADPQRRPMGIGLKLSARRKDGSELPVEISLSPVASDNGTLVTAAVRDVSWRVRAEAALEGTNRELEAFTYSVSHDLRAPIRQIDGFARLLDETLGDIADSRSRHYLSRIQDGARHMARLVDDLLALAHVGRSELRPARTDLSRVLREVLADMQPDLAGREIEWHISPLPMVECDRGLVKIVLTNLVSNAVKYTRPRRPAVITIRAREIDGRAAVSVEDNGVGFDMKYADQLFGVFQRLHRSDEFEGTGVGLATVQRIVHKHGGTIWADARPGHGATFSFTLSPAPYSTVYAP